MLSTYKMQWGNNSRSRSFLSCYLSDTSYFGLNIVGETDGSRNADSRYVRDQLLSGL